MGCPFLTLALALGLKFGSWKFTSSCFALQQAVGQLFFLLGLRKGNGKMASGFFSVRPCG